MGCEGSGLAVLLAVPFLIYSAAGPNTYPPVNPDTGGPTGASQLESSLGIVAVVLLLPFGLRGACREDEDCCDWLVCAGCGGGALHCAWPRECEPSQSGAVCEPGQFAGLAGADAGLLRGV